MTVSCARCWREKKALIFGIANEESIAYSCAKAFRSLGADLAVSWLNEKARGFVEPLAQELGASITGGVDVSSLCAVKDGRSVASTMGFTAVDGLMMGTRCGAVDAGVILYMMQRHGMDAAAIENLIYRQSGLLGVSGISSDMRALRASPDPAAKEAIALFVYRIVRELGSLVAALGGIDGLVFSAGIGEHDASTRAEVVEGSRWTGAILDLARNQRSEGLISADNSSVAVWVIPTDEERLIARHTAAMLQ